VKQDEDDLFSPMGKFTPDLENDPNSLEKLTKLVSQGIPKGVRAPFIHPVLVTSRPLVLEAFGQTSSHGALFPVKLISLYRPLKTRDFIIMRFWQCNIICM
jgi:hypothetical protein